VSCSALSAALALPACTGGSEIQVFGESVRPKRGESVSNDRALFDGQRVELRGVRGETLGLGVQARSPVTLHLPESAARVDAFSVRSLDVREPSSEMYGPNRGRGNYPDILQPVSGAVSGELAFFDVAIARDARPGTARGTLVIGERRIDVALRIDGASIDLEKDPLLWVFYLPKEIARAHRIPENDAPELIDLEAKYHDLFRAHGALLAADLPPQRFPPRRRFVRDVRYWPVAVDVSSDETIAADTRAWVGYFRGSRVTPFAIPVDEPHTTGERQRARHIAEVMGGAGAGAPGLLRAVTDLPAPEYGGVFDVYFAPSDRVPPLDRRTLPFFTYNGKPPAAGSMVLDADAPALRTWGWIAYRYRIELWYAWEGLYFTDRYNGGPARDVTAQPITFDERLKGGTDWGNGDGVLAYPGPLPSLRLKTLRRGLSDRLLLQKLESCGGGAEARRIAERVIPRALGEAGQNPSWPAQELEWERARIAVLDAIEIQCGKVARHAG